MATTFLLRLNSQIILFNFLLIMGKENISMDVAWAKKIMWFYLVEKRMNKIIVKRNIELIKLP